MPPLPTSTPKRRLWRRNWRRTKLRSRRRAPIRSGGWRRESWQGAGTPALSIPSRTLSATAGYSAFRWCWRFHLFVAEPQISPPPIRTAKPLEFRHQERQGAFGGRRAKHDQKLVLDVTQEADDRKAERPRNRTQYDQNEDRRGRIEGENKVEKVPERARPIARGSISTITSRSMTFAIPRTPNHQRARR